MARPRLVFGFMTGTSCDGLDAAAVRIHGAGLDLRARIIATTTLDFGPLAAPVRDFARGEPATSAQIARLALDLAELHAQGVRRLRADAGDPDLVAIHGQTVFHDPPASWQLVNPWPIALAAGCPVISDLRGADLAAGGQGAPITPIADWILFRHPTQTRAVVNLGGFCNITLLPAGKSPEAIQARDLCACNHVLDAAARALLAAPFDADGAAAARGTSDQRIAAELESRLRAQARSGRSLGSADELIEAAEQMLSTESRLTAEDAMATATAALASAIAAEINDLSPPPDTVLVAGGSIRNRALMTALAEQSRATVTTTADFGIDPQYREAAAMAILGCLAADGTPVTLPHVTGASQPILCCGLWTNQPPARTPR